MPMRAPRICQCGLKVASGTVCICQQRRKVEADKRRPSARQRGYDKRWECETADYLARPENKFCACGCGKFANMVDHKVAHKGDMRLFWDRANWQPMNRRCNSRKAASREGGFGNPKRAGMALQ
jgi:5-methylcytosine-specific restriction endonuclease McrA